MSIVQLIYTSEVGILLLKSPIPLRLSELAAIFLVRTAIALPVLPLSRTSSRSDSNDSTGRWARDGREFLE